MWRSSSIQELKLYLSGNNFNVLDLASDMYIKKFILTAYKCRFPKRPEEGTGFPSSWSYMWL